MFANPTALATLTINTKYALQTLLSSVSKKKTKFNLNPLMGILDFLNLLKGVQPTTYISSKWSDFYKINKLMYRLSLQSCKTSSGSNEGITISLD